MIDINNIKYDNRLGKDAYVSTLNDIMFKNNEIIHVDTDLMSCIGINKLITKYPNRIINVGIAEANAIGIAAGLSLIGKIPFVHSFACFISRRAFDQSFISIAYAKLNVKLIGSDPGIEAAFNGGTHMAFEDMALYMNIPNAILVEPTDYNHIKYLINSLSNFYGLSYMRLPRKQQYEIYDAKTNFELGKGITLTYGNDITIICSGIMVYESLKAYQILRSMNISARVINIFTWKPLDEDLIINAARETKFIITVENHNIICGLGSVIANLLSKKYPTKIIMIGIDNAFGEVGSVNFLKDKFELTEEKIVNTAINLLN